jgi:hypothetical protein
MDARLLITQIEDKETSEDDKLKALVTFFKQYTVTTVSGMLHTQSKRIKQKALGYLFLQEFVDLITSGDIVTLGPYMFAVDDTSWFEAENKMYEIKIRENVNFSKEIVNMMQMPTDELVFGLKIIDDTFTQIV